MKSDAAPLGRETLFRWFFLGVFGLVLWQCGVVLLPFFPGFLWAFILTLMFHPVHRAVLRLRRWGAGTAAFLSTIGILLVIILPMVLIGWMFVKESAVVYPSVRGWEKEFQELKSSPDSTPLPPAMEQYVDKAQDVVGPLGVDLRESAIGYVETVSDKVNESAAHAARHFLLTLFNFVVLAVSLFFFLRHGEAYIAWFMDLLPMEAAHKKHLFESVSLTFTAVVRGVLMAAMLQAFLLGVGFKVAGVHFPVFLGVASLFAALIPLGGTFLVWLPVCVYRASNGGLAPAVVLAVWCCFAFVVDHVLKAYLIGTQARLPIFLLFLALMGGIYAYGFIGILLGPVVVASALAVLRIYREQYGIRLPSE